MDTWIQWGRMGRREFSHPGEEIYTKRIIKQSKKLKFQIKNIWIILFYFLKMPYLSNCTNLKNLSQNTVTIGCFLEPLLSKRQWTDTINYQILNKIHVNKGFFTRMKKKKKQWRRMEINPASSRKVTKRKIGKEGGGICKTCPSNGFQWKSQ